MKNDASKTSILNSLQPKVHIDNDFVNLQYENPVVTLGPMIKDLKDSCPPFYISLKIHDKILHNCLLDSGASHNPMPKAMMDEISLSITKPYHDLFSFDSRKLKCLGLNQILFYKLNSATFKKCNDGHCNGWYSSKIWCFVVPVMEQKIRRHPSDGSHVHHHSHVWRGD